MGQGRLSLFLTAVSYFLFPPVFPTYGSMEPSQETCNGFRLPHGHLNTLLKISVFKLGVKYKLLSRFE